MRRLIALLTAVAFFLASPQDTRALLYAVDSTIPSAGGCPLPNHFNLALSSPLNRRWSTSIPFSLLQQILLTVAPSGTPAQLDEIELAVPDSFGAWSGVSGTTFNASTNPGLVTPLARVAAPNS